jgi:hypothetical protein
MVPNRLNHLIDLMARKVEPLHNPLGHLRPYSIVAVESYPLILGIK